LLLRRQALTLGDIAGELIDLADVDPEEELRKNEKAGTQQDDGQSEKGEEGEDDAEDVPAEKSAESLGDSLSSLESTGLECESSTESLGLDPNVPEYRAPPSTGSQILATTTESPEEQEEGGYREQTHDDANAGDNSGDTSQMKREDRSSEGMQESTADKSATAQERESADEVPTDKVDAEEAQTASPLSPMKIKVDYGPDGKNSIKYQKMVGTMKDLELKRLRDGSLKLMEERQYALLVRQINKMDAEAARLDEEARIKAEEDARFKPRGTISWTIRVDELDESAMGMRVGIVHRSLEPGEDWGDYSASNNKVWWWNSFSGSLFVGDVMVPESGNVRSMTTINQWAPSRTNPMMGVPWMQGDVLTVSLELEKGEVTFAKNGQPTPHIVRGVWGEVFFAVQMSAAGDRVTLLEPDADKKFRIERLMREEKERMEIARVLREAKRKEALAALGLV